MPADPKGKGKGNGEDNKNPVALPILNKVAQGSVGAVVDHARSKQSSGQEPSSLKTVKAALEEKLPDLPCTNEAELKSAKYYDISSSSKTTSNQTPPGGWMEEKESEAGSVKAYFPEFANIENTLAVPATERSHYLSNEQDVVRASTLYLLHLVNLAAQDWLESKGDKRQLICTSETPAQETKSDGTSLRTRTDIEWRLGLEESAPRVAVLEFKRKHTINPDELNKAKFPARNFVGSSDHLLRQATHYITAHYKPPLNDICVFDWDTLFILNFEGWDVSNPDESLPKGILHQELGEHKWGSGQYTFRQLLLAFLIRALTRTDPSLKSEETPNARPPQQESPRHPPPKEPEESPQQATGSNPRPPPRRSPRNPPPEEPEKTPQQATGSNQPPKRPGAKPAKKSGT